MTVILPWTTEDSLEFTAHCSWSCQK